MESLSNINKKLSFLNDILNRKIEILNQILNISENQKMFLTSLQNENELNSYLSISLKEKQALINEIKNIDTSFINTFEQFGGELNKNKDFFKNDIQNMKDKIQQITDLDLKVRITEEKNKPFFQDINLQKNKPIKTLKANKSYILNKYSQNTKKLY